MFIAYEKFQIWSSNDKKNLNPEYKTISTKTTSVLAICMFTFPKIAPDLTIIPVYDMYVKQNLNKWYRP